MRVGIIGLGWLASRFATFLPEELASIWGTSTNKRKLTDALREKAECFNFELGANSKHLPISKTDLLLFTIPPSKIEDYSALCIQFFKDCLEIKPDLKIVFISSTSVYGNQNGELDESSDLKGSTSNALKIIKVEEYLEEKNSVVLRCGGLVGEDRHPVYYLAGRKNVSSPNAPVNLIHEHDVSRFLLKMLKDDSINGVYNLVSPQHPSRKEYYSEVAERLNLKSIEFENTDDRKGKIVNPKRLLGMNFLFEYSSPFEMPLVRK